MTRYRKASMAELTPQAMADKLLAAGFKRTGPSATALSDPIADTPMVVTLDELRPYDHDPRVMRNPVYDEIKASILERGLDAPPAITRRPGEAFYIVRNGGNTRLAILRELWAETKNERFFRIPCLFRPWPERGEIVMLTGHLAENELRGGLTFIERALGIEKAREFYENEIGQALSQSELARRLAADGFPVQQSHISRMQDAVHHLLPAIPTVLYGGLGRHQVERLAVLRRAGERIWEQRAKGRSPGIDFASLFHDVLVQFDALAELFSTQRVQDELVGQMAELLGVDYDTLSLEIDDSESRQRALSSEPKSEAPVARRTQGDGEVESGHATPVIDRLQSNRRRFAEELKEEGRDAEPDVLGADAISIRLDACAPAADVWHIESMQDSPERLRARIAQLARAIANEADVGELVSPSDGGIGFNCVAPDSARSVTRFAQAVLRLLETLSVASAAATEPDRFRLVDELAPLLHGHGDGSLTRLSDDAMLKLFRLLRLARCLRDLEKPPVSDGVPSQP